MKKTIVCVLALILLAACADAPKGKRSLDIDRDRGTLKFESDTRDSAPADKED